MTTVCIGFVPVFGEVVMSQRNPTVSLGAVSLGVGIDTARYGHQVIAKSILTNAKPIPSKAWPVRDSPSSNGPRPRRTIRRNFSNCAIPSP
jgi:hypothetical protein